VRSSLQIDDKAICQRSISRRVLYVSSKSILDDVERNMTWHDEFPLDVEGQCCDESTAGRDYDCLA
jgi:hypothetical protein